MLYCTQEDFCNRTERKCPNMNDIDSLEYAEWKRKKINRDVRNTFLVILALVLALLAILAAIIADIHKAGMKTFEYGMSSYEADFSAHKADFEFLAGWACGFWEEQKARDASLTGIGMNQIHIWLNYAGKDSETIEIPGQLKSSLQGVMEAFHTAYGYFVGMYVNEDYVVFSGNGYYEVLYTVDGSKPTAYFQNQKRYHKDTDTYYWDYYIEKLKSHWYQGIMYSKDYEEQ